MLIWTTIAVLLICAYWAGWQGAQLYHAGERLRVTQESEEYAAAEYERGCADGWAMGLSHGVDGAKRVVVNKDVLTELAAQRFAVGGARPNE